MPTLLITHFLIAAQGKYTEAENSLQEALDKDPNSADALINFFMNSSFVGKSLDVGLSIFTDKASCACCNLNNL